MPKVADQLINAILNDYTVHSATKYISPRYVIRATIICYANEKKRGRRSVANNTVEIKFKIGAPNYSERKFIKDCKKAGVSFPVRKIQIKHLKGK